MVRGVVLTIIYICNIFFCICGIYNIEEVYEEFDKGNILGDVETIGDILFLLICLPSFCVFLLGMTIKKYILNINLKNIFKK